MESSSYPAFKISFWRFHRESYGLSRLRVPPVQRQFSLILSPCLVGYFLCWNSIFHLSMVALWGFLLPFFAVLNRFPPHTQANKATTLLNTRHSTSTSDALREFAEEGRYPVYKGLSYIYVRHGLQLYSVLCLRPARLCIPCRFSKTCS